MSRTLLLSLLVGCASPSTPPSVGDKVTPWPQDSGTGNDTAGADTGNTATACLRWCTAMENNCIEEAFLPQENCMQVCNSHHFPILPEGTDGDTDTHTLECRIHHAERAAGLAGSDRSEACAAAHASGGDTCGSWCDVYCQQVNAVCGPDNPGYDGPALYATESQCQNACAEFPTEVMPGVSQTEQQFGYGNTVQCRMHHLQADLIHDHADDTRFDLHCPHASAASTEDTCQDVAPPNIPNYCHYAVDFCTGDLALFPDGTDRDGCAAMLTPLVGDTDQPYRVGNHASFADTDTNTLGCLNHWVVLAPIDPETYCPKADWNPENWSSAGGTGVCTP